MAYDKMIVIAYSWLVWVSLLGYTCVIDFATNKMDEFLHSWSYWYLTPDPGVRNSTEIMALARPFPHKVAGTPTFLQFDP